MTELTIHGEIKVLRLQDGDIIVCSIRGDRIKAGQADELRADLEHHFPGHKCIIATEGIKLSVARDEST